MVNKQKQKTNQIWIKRKIKDSDYDNHWEYKKIDKKQLAAYSKSRWSKGLWQIHSKFETVTAPGFDTQATMSIDDSKIVVSNDKRQNESKIVVAKANVRIV